MADRAKVNIIVVSRLAYRKGVDLLIAVAPKICEKYQHVNFIIGMNRQYPNISLICFL